MFSVLFSSGLLCTDVQKHYENYHVLLFSPSRNMYQEKGVKVVQGPCGYCTDSMHCWWHATIRLPVHPSMVFRLPWLPKSAESSWALFLTGCPRGPCFCPSVASISVPTPVAHNRSITPLYISQWTPFLHQQLHFPVCSSHQRIGSLGACFLISCARSLHWYAGSCKWLHSHPRLLTGTSAHLTSWIWLATSM